MQTTLSTLVGFASGIDPLIRMAIAGILFVVLVEVAYMLGGIIGMLPNGSPFRRY